MKSKYLRKFAALALTGAMVVTAAVPAFAEDITTSQETTKSYTYSAPTSPMAVDDNIITATAHRAASPILGMMGLNATAGFGMINGGAPSNLADAETRAALGVWGTSLNSNPDPYYWNYFYNFYAKENGLEESANALNNANVAASPAQADGTLYEEYGNVSVSLSTRPEIVVGCASKSNGTSTNGYDDQIATINGFTKDSPYYQEGDENYSPELVSYQMTQLKDMIGTVERLATAIDKVEAETGETTRYGDPDEIAEAYEDYVYGTIAYIKEELDRKGLEEKTVAVLLNIEGNGTYDIATESSTSATSLVRAYEYVACNTKNLAETCGTESTYSSGNAQGGSSSQPCVNVTKEELLTADAIVTLNNSSITQDKLEESFGDSTYKGIILASQPATLYGITMNSVENAMGLAYTLGYIYSDELDINPVDMCAYFYQKFLHIDNLSSLDTVIKTNFADTTLPKGVSASRTSKYSIYNIEMKIYTGKEYFESNPDAFYVNTTNTGYEEFKDLGISSWIPNMKVPTREITAGEAGSGIKSVSTVTDSAGNTIQTIEYDNGATSVVTTAPDGTVTTEDTDAKGNKAVQIDNVDGTSTIECTNVDGSTSTGTIVNGKTSYDITLSDAAAASTETVTLPVRKVSATTSSSSAPVLNITNPGKTDLKVSVPLSAVSEGVVAVAVDANGNEKVLKFSYVDDTSLNLEIQGNTTIKIIDRSDSFTDVSADNWAAGSVDFATSHDLFNGTSSTAFSPDGSMTRAMLMTVLARLDDQDTTGGSTWYEKGMNWSKAQGISDGSNPDGNVTREQLATMLYRYAGSPAVTDDSTSEFTDADSISPYAADALNWAVSKGIISGMGDGTVNPAGNATRAQVAAMIQRYVKAA